ncbi:MAG: DUF4249 domain-containing protein [Bacteroidota bacterium]
MKKYIALILIPILFLMVGCTPKGIDIDVAPAESRIVVASQIIPQKSLVVALTKSFSPLEPIATSEEVGTGLLDNFLVQNALVTVSYNNQTDTLSMLLPGIYVSNDILLTNYNTYTLNVTEPSTGMAVSAVTSMLPQVKFDTVYPIVARNVADTVVSVKYVLHDNPAEENFYVVNYILKQASTGANLDISSYFGNGSNKILSIFELLNDASFTNSELIHETILSDVTSKDSIAVEVAHISKGYYEFLTAAKRTGGLITQLTSEPIHFPTNVHNGYGFFNAYFPDAKIFFVEEY